MDEKPIWIPTRYNIDNVSWSTGICVDPPLEVGISKILVDHVRVKGLRWLVRPLNEIQRPSQLHGHIPWLECEVALRFGNDFGTYIMDLTLILNFEMIIVVIRNCYQMRKFLNTIY